MKDSPHPNAGKLWVEHILSDEGALGYLEGGAIPARYAALLAAGKVSEEHQRRTCPMPRLIESITFPTAEQIDEGQRGARRELGPHGGRRLVGASQRDDGPIGHRRGLRPSRPSRAATRSRWSPAGGTCGLARAAPVPRLPRALPGRGRRSRSSPRRCEGESGVTTSALTRGRHRPVPERRSSRRSSCRW